MLRPEISPGHFAIENPRPEAAQTRGARRSRLPGMVAFLALISCSGMLAAQGTEPALDPPITAQEKAFWAFQKPVRPELPRVQDSAWVRTPVDAFVLAQLERAGLKPAPPADKATLLRRVTFDLIGLPPTPEEVEAFLTDPRPDAYERVVERLLASPQYGERWAQHWLDVVRFAESNGYEADGERPHAWRYRDYVIQSFNDDKPYDRFVMEQVAGDELAQGQEPRRKAELLIATGFHLCGPVHVVAGNTDPEVNRQEVLTEMTGAIGSAFLGLTVGCARCHNHKFDPISQADYYRLQAFFAAAQSRDVDIATPQEMKTYEKEVRELNARLAPLRKKVDDLDQPYKTLLSDLKRATLEPKYQEALDVPPARRTREQQQLADQAQVLLKVSWDELLEALTPAERAQRTQWRTQIHDLEARMPPPPPHAWSVRNQSLTPPTYVLKYGSLQQKGPRVLPAWPRILADDNQVLPSPPLRGRGVGGEGEKPRLTRTDLARWLTSPDNSLTARVIVNRLWQHHFGRGLVATPNDFGAHGARPTHPELLNWLATELIAHGWSLKHLHRLMVLSSTYRQASRPPANARARQVDPDNKLLGHMNRQRLEGEALRDSVLAVAGTLNPKRGGPSVRVPLEPEVVALIFTEDEPDGRWLVTPDPQEHTRRSIYLFAKRNVRLPLFEAFDRPDLLTSCPVRPVSTFAPQALILLNGSFFQEQSRAFAARLWRECGADRDRQIDRAFRLTLGRPPRAKEQQLARAFLASQTDLVRSRIQAGEQVSVPEGLPANHDPAAAVALADFCLALLNRNEFVYVN